MSLGIEQMGEKRQLKSGSHPWLIGAAVGGVIFIATIASATWFPQAPEPLSGMTIGGGAFALGILISTYWRFLGCWRLWISMAVVIGLDAVCIRVFLEQIRQLSLWDIDVILALELGATMLFLNWFLDTKKARAEMAGRKR